jgi:hypothetical protein
MPQSYLIFDFGANEEAAQQARHRIEGWKQAFRLDKKLLLKFERSEVETAADEKTKGEKTTAETTADRTKGDQVAATKASGERTKGEKPKAEKPKAEKTEEEQTRAEETNDNQHIRLIVRLDFSDHERLSHHRWLERIPTEEPFKDASPQIVRHGEAEFAPTAELFDSLT